MSMDVSPVALTPLDAGGKPRVLTPEEKAKADDAFGKSQYLSQCKLALSHAKDSRRRYDYEWMVRDLYRRGYQFSRYQPSTQTVILASRQTARIPINITLAQMRSIRNQVTSFRPKFEVMPRNTSDESHVQARYSQKLLDYYFDHLNLKKKIKETVIQGLQYSIGGPWQVVYDEEKKEINIWLIDPFDFYFDPLAESLEDAEFAIKAVRRPLDEIVYNPEYDKAARKEVTGGEGRLAVSEYKQFMLQALKYTSQFDRAEAPTIILFEGYFRIRDEETGKAHLRKVVWTEQNFNPLEYEDLDTNDYDFAIYHADINPKEVYGESWMKHVMPINRVINSLESSVYDYNYRVAKGRIVVDKDSGVRSISNVHGEIISKNRGAEVSALNMPPLPVATSAQIERMNRYIEDIGGAHDASLGRIPPGVKCVDLKTKALTKNGFVTMDKLRNGDEIYTVNQKTLKGEWQPIITVHKYENYEGEIYEIKNRNIDAVVTPNHKWFVQQISGSRKETHFLVETKNAKLQQSVLLGAKLDENKEVSYSDVFVELIGWVVTEGTYKKEKEGSWGISISQSYKANPTKCERIVKIVSENTNDFYTMKSESNHALRVNFSKELGKKIRQMFPDKVLTYEFINKLTVKQMEILKKAMILGDGNIRGNNERFFTTEKKMADVFMYMCVLLGYTCHTTWYERSINPKHKDYCEISIKKSKYTDAFNTNRKESYINKVNKKLYVWCPETVNGTFIAERNGNIYVTGNSGIGIAELKQSDATSQDDLVDNLEDFLTLVAGKMLQKIAENYDERKVVQDLGIREEDSKYFAVIGEKYAKKYQKKPNEVVKGHEKQIKVGPDWLDLAIIGKDNNIRVTIGSWLGYTKEMMQEKLLKLAQAGFIDQKTFLTLWEFGDVDKIVQQTRTEQILKSALAKRGPNEPPSVDPYVENDMMVLEHKPVMPDMHDDHWVHVVIHQEALGQGADDLVSKHIAAHQMYMGEPQQLDQLQPEQPQLGGMGQPGEGLAPEDIAQALPPVAELPNTPQLPPQNPNTQMMGLLPG